MATTKDKMEFAYLMAKHSQATQGQIQRLMRYGSTMNRLAEKQCNEPWTDADQAKRDRIKTAIRKICCFEIEGVTGVVLSNDPRGATIKIQVKDGVTNDWGREGICVPTS